LIKTSNILNLEYFIAKRISNKGKESFSGPVIRVSQLSISLGLAVMILSIAIVVGFKNTVSSKVTGFSSQLKIVPFDNNQSLEEQAITLDKTLIMDLKADKNISHINFTAKKAGVIKTESQIQGIVFKGLDKNYDFKFLKESLFEGRIPDLSNKNDSVLVSLDLSRKLRLKIGDDLRVWFLSGNNSKTRGRKFKICGIYNTGLEEFDSRYIIGDLRHIRKLNGWGEDQVGSIELFCKDMENIDETQMELYKTIPYNLQVISIKQEYPQIFNWLDLLDTNVAVVLILMILVSGITMVSTLFIIIMERTGMIGVLKSLGMRNGQIRKIFLHKAANIIGKGMLWGNAGGLGLYLLQYYFQILKLSSQSYYVDYVPVELYFSYYLYLNLATFLLSLLIIIGPSYYITRISPAKALRYE
jgi:lipoprotein-releasing system permease protein